MTVASVAMICREGKNDECVVCGTARMRASERAFVRVSVRARVRMNGGVFNGNLPRRSQIEIQAIPSNQDIRVVLISSLSRTLLHLQLELLPLQLLLLLVLE